jgi:hypothetical protein
VKHGRNPTVAQANLIKSVEVAEGKHLDPNKFLVVKNTSTELIIVHRETETQRSIKKATAKASD